MTKNRYGVVLNDLQLPDGDVHTLGAGWEMRRATADELAQFKPVVESLYNAVTLNSRPTPPPHEAEISIAGRGVVRNWGSLQPSKWRYWTVHRTDPDGLSADGLIEALVLSDTELFVDYWPNGEPDSELTGYSRVGSHAAITRFFGEILGWDHTPQSPDLDEIRDLVGLRAGLSVAQYPEVHRMLQLFSYTAELHERSGSKFLAYLAIVEGLLTHKPKPQDRIDSIAQQLKRNILLLDNRMPPHQRLGLDSFSTRPDKVIDKLYSYRSALAHGGDPADELDIFRQKWKEPTTTLELHRFARRLTRLLLLAALREPRLVTDLKG